MANPVFRVHPAIGIARVGNSEEFYLGPETMAGLPVGPSVDTGGRDLDGGLPIRAGTESTIISSDELRDSAGRMKRQAARFRIYHYPDQTGGKERYPCGQGEEIVIGSVIGGRTVTDIVWTVHLANKKANSYMLNDMLGMQVYDKAHASDLHLRNAAEGDDLNNAARLRRLVIDPGPRAIRGAEATAVRFDKATIASHATLDAAIETLPHYPKTFPDDSFARMYTPTGGIETLGELRTDQHGRLLVLPAWGRAAGWLQADGTPFPLVGGLIAPGEYGDVNADGWFDDTGDGPVSARICFDDGAVVEAAQAWAITTDPSYAPQTLNVISLWDDMYDTWVRKLDLVPDLFDHRFNTEFAPLFDDHLKPIFRAPALQRWNTNLPSRAIAAHDAVAAIAAGDKPGDTIMTGLAYVRDPNDPEQTNIGAPFMPLSMGDAGKAFLTVTRTQYFFLEQWDQGRFKPDATLTFGPGEAL
ncbi:MAG: LodA/GoxA family CTQ-dependent oxidase, partial [Caulobacter sp.]